MKSKKNRLKKEKPLKHQAKRAGKHKIKENKKFNTIKPHKTGGKKQDKFVVVIPEESLQKSGLKEGDKLEIKAKRGKIILRRQVEDSWF